MITFLAGTYTTGTSSEGIYRAELDTEKNCFISCTPVIKAKDPSYLAKYGNSLFAVNENLEPDSFGQLLKYHFQKDGSCLPEGCVSTEGVNPCHLALSPDRQTIAVCNYTSGSCGIYRTENLKKCCFHQGMSHSVHPRQLGSHAHQATWWNGGWLICDLGGDCIWKLNPDGSCNEKFLCAPAGSGPRHLVLNHERVYVGTELSNELLTFSLSDRSLLYRQSTLKNGKKESAVAAVRQMNDKIYVSNRGEDTVSVFSLENPDCPKKMGTYSVNGKNPRDILVFSEGILCACTTGVTWLKREADESYTFAASVEIPSAVSLLQC